MSETSYVWQSGGSAKVLSSLMAFVIRNDVRDR